VARVFVRPDSFLGTLPFEVIPLEKGKYLIEEKDFVYVQTPNDLVQKEQRSSSAPASLLAVGGVDFKKRAELEEKSSAGVPIAAVASMSDELRGSLNHFWSRLPHTENEAQTVSDLFEAAFPAGERLFLSGDLPSEERLKQELPRHPVAHLATHGFFNPEGTVSMWDSAQEAVQREEHGGLAGLETETRALVGALPGLLTGLVCAGANEPAPTGRDDGLLTAEEVLWLDLSKVDLVVLSACETALGERRSGEGMIGLRRAFGLAGAKTVVSSLWSVKDSSTSELMQRFYENLWLKKQGRADALRNAQLEMLAKNRAIEHDALPSTWGAFVLSGEWR
jgi:CHAT domain-containing protein